MKKKPTEPKHPTASKPTQSSKVSTASTESISKWIRIEQPLSLPSYVKEALSKLDAAGHLAYLVGGSVRDYFLKRPSKDHDIATSATPEQVKALFPEALDVGKAFGVMKVPVAGAPELEIATFREDEEYEDHRHPKGIRYAGITSDAKRRDFTVNALYYDPKSIKVFDPVGGLEDINKKVIRAIGDPVKRFKEDALRLLRAVRFTSNLGFSLEHETSEAIRSKARLITQVSWERIRDEIEAILTGADPAGSLELLSQLGILRIILPELESMHGIQQSPLYHPEGDVWRHSLKILKKLASYEPKRSAALCWATLLHDVGKGVALGNNGGKNFKGHEQEGIRLAKQVGDRFRLPLVEQEQIENLIAEHGKFREVFQMRESTLERFIRLEFFSDLLALHRADVSASDGNLAYYEFCKERHSRLKSLKNSEIPKLIDGRDLIQLGISPGPKFSEILRTIEDLALEKKIATKEQALEYVVSHFVH